MKLKKLIKDINDIQIKGPKDVTISGISTNSKTVAPGNLFIAKRGKTTDGAGFIPEAIDAGAAAILTDICDPSLKNITQVLYPEVAKLEGLLAARYYEFPSDQLLMVGITGTNGKTTSSYMIKHLLDQLHGPCGLIGTIEYLVGDQSFKATHTTPDAVTNHKMLKEMVLHGCRSCTMEVTSHGLDQRRVDSISFDIALFTNLTPEHLDYHVTMETYCAAKNKLFLTLNNTPQKRAHKVLPTAIVNSDSEWQERILRGCQAKVITYGINNKATLRADNIVLEGEGTSCTLLYEKEKVPCFIPLAGRYNLYNALGALAVGLAAGAPLTQLAERMRSFPAVPGRLAPVPNALGIHIYVDFAHTEDALRNVLTCLQETKKKRILTVFGCGGNRDCMKRPKMAAIAEELSDFTIVTTDNPRTEDPAVIIEEIVAGFKNRDSYAVELDRRSAIQKALEMAQEGDIVLIAGRGHESHQIFAHKTIPFNDSDVATELCLSHAGATV